jgi:hypothetical protein
MFYILKTTYDFLIRQLLIKKFISLSDSAVLKTVETQGIILVTFDADFVELFFRRCFIVFSKFRI